MSPSPAIVMTRQQRWWIWLCVAAVMGFQALGLVHRTLHGSPAASSRVAFTIAAFAAAAEAAVETTDTNETTETVEMADATADRMSDAGGDTIPVIADAVTADDGSALRFGHAAGTPDCQLLDQLSHVLGPIVQATAWATLPPDIPTGIDQPHDATLAQQWRKGARGPPRA